MSSSLLVNDGACEPRSYPLAILGENARIMLDQTYGSEAMIRSIAPSPRKGIGVMVRDLGKEIFYRIEGGSVVFLLLELRVSVL